MKFVSDSLSFSAVDANSAAHTIKIPVYHRSSVGLFPGTRLFAVPLRSTNEIVLTPIDPQTWGDLWRLEATVSDKPGSANALVQTLVKNDVNVLVHEGVSESAEDGQTVHRVFEILDLSKYCDDIDGVSGSRNTVGKVNLRPNHLISRLIGDASHCLEQRPGRDGWDLRFERMEFFFWNKNDRENNTELRLNVNHEVRIPVALFAELKFVEDAKKPVALHIISDTEQKYIKLRVLWPRNFYLLVEIEHAEKVGAIDSVMAVLQHHRANMIDSYSRLQRTGQSALFYALVEFSEPMSLDDVMKLASNLRDSRHAHTVAIKGAFGSGPSTDALREADRPEGVRLQLPEDAARRAQKRGTTPPARDHYDAVSPLGTPYFADRDGAKGWAVQTARVFMAVPFADQYANFYRTVVHAAVREAGLEPVRADAFGAQKKLRHIIDQIEEGIATSRFVIADLSGWNPNVVYEVGLAVGISKPLLMLCQEEHITRKEVPFDLQSYPLLAYSSWEPEALKLTLGERIRQLKEQTEPLHGS